MSSENSGKVKTAVNWLRPIAVVLIVSLFAVDYGFDLMAKPVPKWVYFGLIGIMVGVDTTDIKELIMTVLKSIANKQ